MNMPNAKTIRKFIREELKGVYFFGLKKCQPEDVQSGWPRLYEYLLKNYGDFIKGCKFAIKKNDKLQPGVPYILLPDKSSSVLTWNDSKKSPCFSHDENIAVAIARLK